MAHIDSKIDLLTFDDLKFLLVFLHVYSNEFIADLRCMFSTVYVTKVLLFKLIELLWGSLIVTFSTLLPSDII